MTDGLPQKVDRGRELLSRRDFLIGGALAGGSLILLPGLLEGAEKLFELKVITSQLSQTVGFAHLPVGKKLGFYQKEGIDVQLVTSAGGGVTVRSLMVGGTPVGITAATAAVIAATKGEAIKIVAGDGAGVNIGWVVRGDSDLKSIRDVKGKKLGYSAPGSVSQFLVQKCVRDAGISLSDVQLVAVGGMAEQITALKTGIIDAAMSAEPVVTRMEKEIRVLWWANEFVPEFQQAVVIATDEFIKSEPEILKGFLRAHGKAHEFLQTNPEEGARIWAEEVKFSPDIAARGMRNHPKNYFSLKLTVKGLKALEEGMLEMKAIDRKVEWGKIIDQRFLDPKSRINLSDLGS